MARLQAESASLWDRSPAFGRHATASAHDDTRSGYPPIRLRRPTDQGPSRLGRTRLFASQPRLASVSARKKRRRREVAAETDRCVSAHPDKYRRQASRSLKRGKCESTRRIEFDVALQRRGKSDFDRSRSSRAIEQVSVFRPARSDAFVGTAPEVRRGTSFSQEGRAAVRQATVRTACVVCAMEPARAQANEPKCDLQWSSSGDQLSHIESSCRFARGEVRAITIIAIDVGRRDAPRAVGSICACGARR